MAGAEHRPHGLLHLVEFGQLGGTYQVSTRVLLGIERLERTAAVAPDRGWRYAELGGYLRVGHVLIGHRQDAGTARSYVCAAAEPRPAHGFMIARLMLQAGPVTTCRHEWASSR